MRINGIWYIWSQTWCDILMWHIIYTQPQIGFGMCWRGEDYQRLRSLLTWNIVHKMYVPLLSLNISWSTFTAWKRAAWAFFRIHFFVIHGKESYCLDPGLLLTLTLTHSWWHCYGLNCLSSSDPCLPWPFILLCPAIQYAARDLMSHHLFFYLLSIKFLFSISLLLAFLDKMDKKSSDDNITKTWRWFIF